MLSRAALNMALIALKQPSMRQMPHVLGPLNKLLRHPRYEHEVHYPIDRASAEDDQLLPERAAAMWLYDSARHLEIGPWHCCLCNDARLPRLKLCGFDPTAAVSDTVAFVDKYYMVVSFLMEEDAVLFRLRWI